MSAKHQQLISGVSIPAYWSANFFFDFVLYSIMAAIAVFMVWAFDVEEFTKVTAPQTETLTPSNRSHRLAHTRPHVSMHTPRTTPSLPHCSCSACMDQQLQHRRRFAQQLAKQLRRSHRSCLCACSYLFAYLFKKHGSAQNMTLLLYILT